MGLIAGYVGGKSDSIIMRILDTLLAFPAIFLAIAIVTLVGPGQMNAVLAVAVINVPTFARLTRGTVLSLKEKDFVEAARAMGASQSRIMFKTILPNCISPIMVQMAVAAPAAILVEASLSYPGPGQPAPPGVMGQHVDVGAELPLPVANLRHFPRTGHYDRRDRPELLG